MHRRDPDDRSLPRSRRSGTIQRGELRRAAPPAASGDWIVVVVVVALALGAILAVAGVFNGPREPDGAPPPSVAGSPVAVGSGTAGATQSPAGTSAPTEEPPTPTPTQPPSPTPTEPPTPTPTEPPTPTPTRPPTPSPTARPTATATVAPTARPTPSGVLVIVEPQDGSIVRDRSIVVRGIAPPGAIITRDIPFWFDEHTRADAAGRWSFSIDLVAGDNKLIFRIADDATTSQTLTIRYQPD